MPESLEQTGPYLISGLFFVLVVLVVLVVLSIAVLVLIPRLPSEDAFGPPIHSLNGSVGLSEAAVGTAFAIARLQMKATVQTGLDQLRNAFARFARWAAWATGHPIAFILAVLTIVVWAITGPMFHYSDTWQLVINTGTTIITFLMVFLIQSSQNRDGAAVQIKLDEIIRSIEGARNELLDLEHLDECELDTLRQRYEKLAVEARDKFEAIRRHKHTHSTSVG